MHRTSFIPELAEKLICGPWAASSKDNKRDTKHYRQTKKKPQHQKHYRVKLQIRKIFGVPYKRTNARMIDSLIAMSLTWSGIEFHFPVAWNENADCPKVVFLNLVLQSPLVAALDTLTLLIIILSLHFQIDPVSIAVI